LSLYNTTLSQPFLFAAFIYLGMLLGVVYSVLRILRRIFGEKKPVLVLADLLFMAVAGVSVFFAMSRLMEMKLRFYPFLGVLLGFGIYLVAILPLIRYINCKFGKKKIDNSRGE